MTYTKAEREKDKSILLSTLQYLLEYHSGDMVFDDYSPSKVWYLAELEKTEADIQKYRSEPIKKRLNMHLDLLRNRFDQGLNNYIKENTGYVIDIYEDYRAAAMPLLSAGSIGSQDKSKIENYLKAYGTQPAEQENVAILKALLAKHLDEINSIKTNGKTFTREIILISEGKGFKEITSAQLQKLNEKWLLYQEIAPDGIRKLTVQISGKADHALTYVNISLSGGEGCIFGARGEKLPIKVYWKDNQHIVIETKKEYETPIRYKQVSSYGELVTIEYIFT